MPESSWIAQLALVIASVGAPPAFAQNDPASEATGEQDTQVAEPPAEPPAESGKKKAEILYAPVPFSSPTTGFGIAGGVVALYNPNGSPNQWVTGGGIALTTRGTKALAIFHRMSSHTDRFRLSAFASLSNQDIKFYGIGEADGDRNDPLPLNNKSLGAHANLIWRVAPKFYAGFRYRLTTNDAISDEKADETPSATPPPPADQLKSTLSMLGPVLEYDTRDDHDQPRAGVDLIGSLLFGFNALGDSYDHHKLLMEAHGYHAISARTVLAGSAAMCAAGGEVPYYDLCLFGSSADLRGYSSGRYRDRASWAVQGELRHQFSTRWGGVAFVGVGGIAPSVGDIAGNGNLLPAGGLGVRYRPFKDNQMRLRFDFAVGKDDDGIYLSLGEAF